MGCSNTTLESFLLAWEEHQRLRRTAAPIPSLSESRFHLDRMRLVLRARTRTDDESERSGEG